VRKKRLILVSTLGLAGAVSVLAAIGFFTGGGSGTAASGGGSAESLTMPSLAPRSITDNSAQTSKGFVAGAPARTDANSAPATTDASAAPDSGSSGGAGSLPGLLDRKVILNATLAMNVNDVSGAFDEASRLVRASGGYVEKSSFIASALGVNQKSATLTLRVPADQYDQLLGQLRGMQGAKVTSEGSKSTEVTEQYTDLQSRQRNLERTEQSYLKLLDQAKSVQDILALNDRLDSVRGQIEQIQGRLNVLDHAVDLATIDVTLSPVILGKPGPATGPKPVGQAFADAWAWSLDALRYAASMGAVGLVAVAWLVLPLAVVALGIRRMRRRQPPVQPTPLTSA
jgi:hypothetical protein